MDLNEQRSKAQRVLELHSAPEILKLPNAWDVSSAKIFQLEGYEVIGTTSAGVAATLGYADGQRMSLEDSTQVTKRIAENIDLPVSADIESGYADDVDDVVITAPRCVSRFNAPSAVVMRPKPQLSRSNSGLYRPSVDAPIVKPYCAAQ